MPQADDVVPQDDPLSMVCTAVGATLDDCERALSGTADRAGAEALGFARFLRTELPRLLEDWQMRRRDDLAVHQPPQDPVPLHGHDAAIKDVAFSPDGATLASADEHGVVRLWDARTGHGKGTLVDPSGVTILSLAFSPDATTLATATTALTLWDLESATIRASLSATWSDRVWSVAYGPTNDLVATGNSNDAVKLWNPRTGRVIRTLTHPGTVFAVAISPDGTTLASGGMSNDSVLVWNARTGRRRHVLTGHTDTIHALAFSPDNQILASASYDRTIRLWEVRTGRAIATLTGHTSAVMTVAFHPGGTILASGGASASLPPSGPDYPDDHTVRLWNIHTGRPIATLTGHTGTVSRVAFHPDGTHLVSGSFDTTLRLWPIDRPIDPDLPQAEPIPAPSRRFFGRRNHPPTTTG